MALGVFTPGAPSCSARTPRLDPPSCLAARLGLCQAPALRAPHRPLCKPAKGHSRRRAPATWTCQAAQQATNSANAVSTVKIITQGRNVTVTPAIREYVVRSWSGILYSRCTSGALGRQLSQLRFARSAACLPVEPARSLICSNSERLAYLHKAAGVLQVTQVPVCGCSGADSANCRGGVPLAGSNWSASAKKGLWGRQSCTSDTWLRRFFIAACCGAAAEVHRLWADPKVTPSRLLRLLSSIDKGSPWRAAGVQNVASGPQV